MALLTPHWDALTPQTRVAFHMAAGLPFIQRRARVDLLCRRRGHPNATDDGAYVVDNREAFSRARGLAGRPPTSGGPVAKLAVQLVANFSAKMGLLESQGNDRRALR